VSSALAAVPWSTLIASGVALLLLSVVGLTIRSIIKGDLVPRSAVNDIRADRDKWEQAWNKSQDTQAAQNARLDANTEALRLVEQLLNALASKGSPP
jgi:hypothetical protein